MSPTPRPSRWPFVLLGIAIAAGLGGVAWWRYQCRAPDMAAVMQLNNRGVGLMEQFKYPEAAETFDALAALAPDWTPGHINLGIALLNQNKPETLDRAADILAKVLKKEPDNDHAHYCLGIILYNRGGEQFDEAREHFEHVTRRHPDDPHAWFFLGRTLQEEPEKARECYEKALAANPYLHAALNQLQLLLRAEDPKRADELLTKFRDLSQADWSEPVGLEYGRMGRFGDVIGRPAPGPRAIGPLPVFVERDGFQVRLGQDTRWASATDLGDGPAGELRRAVRKRFGGTLIALDYDGDGKTDYFLTSAVVRGGKVEDLLLRNDGKNLIDVTANAALAGAPGGLGCAAADFDNDGRSDLLITGHSGVRLLRNVAAKEGRGFEDVSKAAVLDTIKGVCLGAAFVDIDQDSDLDIVLARCADSPDQAVAALQDPAKAGGALLLVVNAGASPASFEKDAKPLEPKFLEPRPLPAEKGPQANVLVSDLDDDRDVDLLGFTDRRPPQAVLNDRLLKLRAKGLPAGLVAAGAWNGGLVLDANHDERADLVLVGPGQPARFLVQAKAEKWFTEGVTNAPALLQAHAADIDLDTWTDVVALSEAREPILLHNDGERLVLVRDGLGSVGDKKDGLAVLVSDVDGDGFPDYLLWSESQGLRYFRSNGNGNHSLPLSISGRRQKDPPARTNSDGTGAWVVAQSKYGWTAAELSTLQAGLGRSNQPVLLGLGKATQADLVRIRWPDNVMQAELNLPAGQLARINQENRRTTSCPILFTWNGTGYEYVADFLGAGTMGECLPDGGHRPPRPEESVKIEPHQLRAKDGKLWIKLAEPMDEVTYLDRLRLLVVDHPAGVRVYPDERFIAGSRGPSQGLLAFAADRQVFPARATDHRGRDVTDTLRRRDRAMADGFARRGWLGYAEEHWVELDFADRLAGFGEDDRLCMFLAGWTDYPFPESIWAATQAGVALVPPTLERWVGGKWQPVAVEFGFPAGLPRVMAVELTAHLTGPACKLRVRTNMHVYWDQVYVAPLGERVPADREHASPALRVRDLEVASARLEVRGCVAEFSPDGKDPTVYDHDRLLPIPVQRLKGHLTRLGDVTDLLREHDDCFVVFGPGDEVSVAFDATTLPPLPEGWVRGYVLRTWGYCKDAGPFTATGDTVGPLPFRGMSTFPYGPGEHYPRTPRHEEYLRVYQTRRVGG